MFYGSQSAVTLTRYNIAENVPFISSDESFGSHLLKVLGCKVLISVKGIRIYWLIGSYVESIPPNM